MTAAIADLELALAKDPDFALAHVGIADCYSMLAAYGHSQPIIAYPKAKKELQAALKLNNGISEAHSSLGWVCYNYDWDWENGKRASRRHSASTPATRRPAVGTPSYSWSATIRRHWNRSTPPSR